MRFSQRGAWKFSRSAMQASGKQLLIKETGGRGRYSMYDFSRSSTCADNFVITVAGDYRPCNPFAYQWSNKQWVQQTGGTCNNNDHSQWNCEPEVGIRFHCEQTCAPQSRKFPTMPFLSISPPSHPAPRFACACFSPPSHECMGPPVSQMVHATA